MQAGSDIASAASAFGRLRRSMPAAFGKRAFVIASTAVVLASVSGVHAQDLESYAILAGQSVTNTGPTTITGNIGISPGDTITGVGSITLDGAIYAGNAAALQAQNDLTTLYNFLALRPTSSGGDLTGQDLGDYGPLNPLTAGVYNFDSSALLTGTLVLDAEGDPDAVFIFNIGSTLTTSVGASVQLINGAQGGRVFFRVGSSADLFGATAFAGQIVALTSITLRTAASIDCGAALARNGSVTLDTNTIGICVLAVQEGEFGDVLDEGDTPPTEVAQAVADALDAYIAAFGALPPGFAILAATLSPSELAAALAQLSGEAGSGVASAAMQGADSFASLAFGDRTGRGMSVAPGNDGPMQDANTVSVMGYWEAPTSSAATEVFADLAGGPSRPWDFWISSYGGYSLIVGDDTAGTHDRAAIDYGVAGGVDFLVSSGTRLGIAVGWGGVALSLSDNMGSGRTGMVQVALHGRTEGEAAYFAGGLAYAYNLVTTERHVTIAGDDEFRGEFAAHNMLAELEAGYKMDWLTPYAAIRGQAYLAPAYSESTVSGSSTYALDYEAQRMLSARTELGVRLDWTTELDDGSDLSLRTGAAWAHRVRTGDTVNASFQALGIASSFEVEGAAPAADSLLLNVGAGIDFENAFSIAASLNGEFAVNALAYGGSVKFSHRW